MRLSRAGITQSNNIVAGDEIFAPREFEFQRLLSDGMAVKSNVSKLFTAEKCAARMRRTRRQCRKSRYQARYFPLIGQNTTAPNKQQDITTLYELHGACFRLRPDQRPMRENRRDLVYLAWF
jgi:hypothetical protein